MATLGHAQVAGSIEQIHTRLLQYRLPQVELPPGEDATSTVAMIFLLWQLHLHRVERLMVTGGSALANDDAHGLATLIRAIVESTAVVGGLLASMMRWAASQTEGRQVRKDVDRALKGMKGGVIEPKNILSWIEAADKFIEKTIPEPNFPNQLMSVYSALSEICHPNLLSNVYSMSIGSRPGVVEIKHRQSAEPDPLGLINSFFVTVRLFMDFSFSLHNMLAHGLPIPSRSVLR